MAKEIVTHSWCDVCLNDDVREPGFELVAQVGAGTKAVTVDVCERHRKELADPLAALLGEHGRIIDPSMTPQPRLTKRKDGSDQPGPFICQVPGCPRSRPFAGTSSLGWHVRKVHDMKMGQYRDAFGLVRAELPPDELAAFHGRRAMRQRAEASASTNEKRAQARQTGGDDDFTCPVTGCDQSYPPEKFKRPAQALGVHLARTHGIRSPKAHANTAQE